MGCGFICTPLLHVAAVLSLSVCHFQIQIAVGIAELVIADENNRLKKQYVVTGRTVYGSAVEIKSGLTEDDRIAFPYGKNAVEGAAVTDESSNY